MTWRDHPLPEDFAGARDYLGLITSMPSSLVDDLQSAPTQWFAAKNILRAAGVRAMSPENNEVANDLAAAELSPILLARCADRIHIVDGYHRVSAVFWLDEKTPVPCKIVSLS